MVFSFASARMTTPHDIIAERLLKQAEWCRQMRSPLYSKLLHEAAADVRGRGVCWRVLRGHHDDPPGSALALRFLGAVHRLVLEGRAPHLAACYPSTGGDANCDHLWSRFYAVVHDHATALCDMVDLPVQTNEVGRCAALLGGFLEVVRLTHMPLRLLEVGAAAGLILCWDKYRYEGRSGGWGDPRSPVRISGALGDTHPHFDITATISERRGCDASPIDPGTEDGQLTLQSYVWPDQVERFQRLSAAIGIARRVPAQLDKANAADWVEAALAERAHGVATVVYHSIVWPYLSPDDRTRFEHAMLAAGRAATVASPLAWLRFEPGGDAAEVRLRIWPDREDRLLARSGFHGESVRWLGSKS